MSLAEDIEQTPELAPPFAAQYYNLTHFNTWTRQNGETIRVGAMTAEHLRNTINLLRSNHPDEEYAQLCASYLEMWRAIAELQNRNK
jgi:hypothetical protein